MFSQGSYNCQPGQGPQKPRPPPYLQHPQAPPPPLPHNFQQGPLLPSPQVAPRPGQPGLPVYQHGPHPPPFGVRQVSPGGMPNPGQHFLFRPPTVHRSAPLPHMYSTAQQNPQHPYLTPGPPPPPRILPPTPSVGQNLYRASTDQPPQPPISAKGLQQIPLPPPPPLLPTSSFPTSAISGSTSESIFGNSKSSVPSSSAPPIPNALPLPCSSTLSGSKPDDSPPPKPADEIIHRIEEFCQLIANNGSYEDMVRQKETENPLFKFLFDGEPGSEAAIAHDYFLWMKKKYKAEEIEHVMAANHLVVTELHSPTDSDMEMEDDITGSDIDQAVSHQLFKGPPQATVLNSSEDVEEQLHTQPFSVVSEAATMALSSREFPSRLRLGEQGQRIISSQDGLASGRLAFGHSSLPTSSAQATQYASVLSDDKSSYRAARAVECSSSNKCPGEVMNESSPFRLLQDYASNDSSDNDEDSCLKDVNAERGSSIVAVSTGDLKLNRDTESSLKLDDGSKSLNKTERGFEQLSKSGIACRGPKFSSESQYEVEDTVPTLIASGLTTEHTAVKQNQLSIDQAAISKHLHQENASGDEFANADVSNKYEDNKNKTATQKIDKFGRLVREGASDSDSDDSHARRHSKRGRSRSYSRSRSPMDKRRRRRRSPWRRRENRSRSRSWSPRTRRSRSRSPRNRRNRKSSPFSRHASESTVSMRREKGQMQACFDFNRGKCYRGASCRYLHYESEKNDGSRHNRNKKQFVKLALNAKSDNAYEDSKKFSPKVSENEQENMKREMQDNHDMPSSSILAAKDDIIMCNRVASVGNALIGSDRFSSGAVKEASGKVTETKTAQRKPENATTQIDKNVPGIMESDQPIVVDPFRSDLAADTTILESHSDASKVVLSSLKDYVKQQPQLVLSHPAHEDTSKPDLQTYSSSISDSSPDKTSTTSTMKVHASEALPTSADSLHNPPQLVPFCPPASKSVDNNAPHVSQLLRDDSLMPHTVASQSHSAPLESFPSYMLPSQSSLFSVPLSSSVALPPSPPTLGPAHILPVKAGTAQPVVSSEFQQSCLSTRSAFGSQILSIPPYSTESLGSSHVDVLQHQAYPLVQEPHRSILHTADFRLKPLPGSNPSGQQFGNAGTFGEDCSKQHPVKGLSASDSFTRGNNYPQPLSFSHESPAIKMQSFHGENLPPEEISRPSSQIHPSMQLRQPPHDLHHSLPHSFYGMPEKISSSSRYPVDHQDRNQSLHLPDFGVTKGSVHFNPYASTFEKPLSSRFSSDVFRKENDAIYGSKYNLSFSLSHTSVDVQGVRSKQLISSPPSARGIGTVCPGSAGDQYDPLFDSIEPSSNSYKKSDHIEKLEPSGGSNILLSFKGSNQALDVEENNMKKNFGSTTLATALDNEEFGETADAEVGDVENGSQSNPDALTNSNMGEMEIDQVRSPGKSRKGEESRSMKLFKACLADFVKEVLKPSWRQGNMSKETFKTVVKKTVDKVAGAMKNHKMPKSKAKINQYIDSSQRKLTKLVMGYVDKYAKG